VDAILPKLLLTIFIFAAGCARPIPAPIVSAITPSIIGKWFDIEGQTWTVSQPEPDSFLLVAGDVLTINAPEPFVNRVSGKLVDGEYTSSQYPMQIRSAEIPSTAYRVNTRVSGVLIVTVETLLQWPKPHVVRSHRVELTREQKLAALRKSSDSKHLARALRSPDWTVRRESIRNVAAWQPAGAREILLGALHDEFFTNKILAIQGIARLKDPAPAIPALLSCLLSEQPPLQRSAAAAISHLGPRIAPDLLPFLEPKIDLPHAWTSPHTADLLPQPRAYTGYDVAHCLRTVLAGWDAASLQLLAPDLMKRSPGARAFFLRFIAPSLKPAASATDLVLSFMEMRKPFTTDYQESDVFNAMYAIGQLLDPRAEQILTDWALHPGAGRYGYAFEEARRTLDAARSRQSRR
jgi:hypothetical protein